MNLTADKRKFIGLQYVLDMLDTASPYGAKKIGKLKFYGEAKRQELLTELHNMQCICEVYLTLRQTILQLTHLLSSLKYIVNSLARLDKAILSEVELFEIKSFLLVCEQIEPLYRQLAETKGIVLPPLGDISKPLDLLDDGQRRNYFAVPDNYSETLALVRQEKREIARANAMQTDNALLERFYTLCSQEKKEEENYAEQLCRQLLPYAQQIKQTIEALANLDLLIAKCNLARLTKAVCPKISDTLCAENMSNPYVAARLSCSQAKFTPLSICLPCGSAVITGANMGGKSVALQTLALNVTLANLGFFVYAESFDTPVFDYIDYISGECESAVAGLSSFGAEVVRLNTAYIETRQKKCFLAFDEFAKTTNASEGEKIFAACVKTFNKTFSYAVFTTHFDNVAEYAQAHYRVKGLTRCLDETQLNAGSIADYIDYGLVKVERRQSVPKDAVTICRILGLAQEIMDNIPE